MRSLYLRETKVETVVFASAQGVQNADVVFQKENLIFNKKHKKQPFCMFISGNVNKSITV